MGVLRALSSGAAALEAHGIVDPRAFHYYQRALKTLGAVDESGGVTPAGLACAEVATRNPQMAFARLFAQSPIGRDWMRWEGVRHLSALRDVDPTHFLSQRTALAPNTIRRRAGTLKSWLNYCRTTMFQTEMCLNPPPPVLDQGELTSGGEWPDPRRLPHNMAGETVEKVLLADLDEAEWGLIIVGYAALPELVSLLSRWSRTEPLRPLQILIGAEPRTVTARTVKPLKDEVRDEWKVAGLSIQLADEIQSALDTLTRQQVEVRLATKRRVEARIYVTNRAATIGSSNMTDGGLRRAIVANLRFEQSDGSGSVPSDSRYAESVAYTRQLWSQGEDYRRDLEDLLESLLRYVTWQDALARACFALLEHPWIRDYKTVEDRLPHLWPHQRDGISQALQRLENAGAVMICDPTGSGKTLLGSVLIRVIRDHQLRRHPWPVDPVVVTPSSVKAQWKSALDQLGLGSVGVFSDGLLSAKRGKRYERMARSLDSTELLVVDEAHRFITPTSNRSSSLYNVTAEATALFTATPINREASDLIAMVELIGPSNFEDDVIEAIMKLLPSKQSLLLESEREQYIRRVAEAVGLFMVRRTRADIVRQTEVFSNEYFIEKDGRRRLIRYPARTAEMYPCGATTDDLALAGQINELIDQLVGITWHQSTWKFERNESQDILSEARGRLSRFRGLARYTVRKYLRSSRAAVVWHISGLSEAIKSFRLDVSWLNKFAEESTAKQDDSGNRLKTLSTLAGKPPAVHYAEVLSSVEEVDRWLYDVEAHRDRCEHEAKIYSQIASLAMLLSEQREKTRCELLTNLSVGLQAPVIGFDECLVTLAVFESILSRNLVPVQTVTGSSSDAERTRVLSQLARDAEPKPLVVLASDCFMEAYNLQGARAVVHLNMPTTIRTAEQRMGRVDRIDSRHSNVAFYWPDDSRPFRPREEDPLTDRCVIASKAVGINFILPDGMVDVKAIATAVTSGAVSSKDFPDFIGDAFAPVRELVSDPAFVPESNRNAMKNVDPAVLATVDCPSASEPWCLAAVGADGRRLPSWIMLVGSPCDQVTPQIVTDLSTITSQLRAWLAHGDSRPVASDLRGMVTGFLHRIAEHESHLLSTRRRRTVTEAREVLSDYYNKARLAEGADEASVERARVCRELYHRFTPRRATRSAGSQLFARALPQPDLRRLADMWYRLTEPERALVQQIKRRVERLRTLRDFTSHLLNKCEPIPTSRLATLLSNLPWLAPVDERVVSMIIGLPKSR